LAVARPSVEDGGGQGLAAFCMFFEQKQQPPKILKKNLHPPKPAKAL